MSYICAMSNVIYMRFQIQLQEYNYQEYFYRIYLDKKGII